MKLNDFLSSDSAIRNPDDLKKSNTKKVIEINFSDGEFRSFDGKCDSEIICELLGIMKEKEFIKDACVTELKLYAVSTRADYTDFVYATSIDEAITNSIYSANRIIEVKEIED